MSRTTDVPVFVRDPVGRPRPISTRGLDRESGIYYLPAEGLGDVTPRPEVHVADLEEALDLLLGEEGLLGDFGFVTGSDRAHALGLTLLPFLRDYIDGPTPLHAVLAPDVGSGKTCLAQATQAPGCGRLSLMPGTGQEEEWRKRITSALLAGRPAIGLDNLSGTLDSGALAAALTTGMWEDRVLGASKQAEIPVRNVWVATGNNLGFSHELVRRTVPIFLDRELMPAEFHHSDLLDWAHETRAMLVGACLTLIQHWAAGPAEVEGGWLFSRYDEPPREANLTLLSYPRWASVVGGVLEAAGVEGFLANRHSWTVEADEETREAAEFLRVWHATEPEPLLLRELVARCTTPDSPLRQALPVALASAPTSQLHGVLNAWLRDRRNRRVGDRQLIGEDGSRLRRWWVR